MSDTLTESPGTIDSKTRDILKSARIPIGELTDDQRDRALRWQENLSHLSPGDARRYIMENVLPSERHPEVAAPTLTPEQEARRTELEAQIQSNGERAIEMQAAMGEAFEAIREEELYLDYATASGDKKSAFKRYCAVRWQLDESRVGQLVLAARVRNTVVAHGLPMPANERVVRELAPVAQRRGGDANPFTEEEETAIVTGWQAVLAKAEERGETTPTAKITRTALIEAGLREDAGEPQKASAASALAKFADRIDGLEAALERYATLKGERKPTAKQRATLEELAKRLDAVTARVEQFAGVAESGQPAAAEESAAA